MTSNTPQPGTGGRPAWLMPIVVLALVAVLWSFLGRQGRDSAPAPSPTPPATPIAEAGAQAPAEIRPRPAPRNPADSPGIEAVPDATDEAPAITAELRQERTALFEKLSGIQDPVLASVAKAFEAQGVRQPDVVASGWILAQHWAIAARAEAMVEAKVPEPAKRAELAEVRRRILIGTAEAEVRGLMSASPDARLFSDLEGIGRALKDSPPVDADLLPNRAAAKAARNAVKPKSDLPSEE